MDTPGSRKQTITKSKRGPKGSFFVGRKEAGKMATRGRKPKPTVVKMLEGNPGKRQLNLFEPRPEREMKPLRAPEWLEKEAKAEWNRLNKNLFELGLLTKFDVQAFALYCQAYARWREAEEFITQHGSIVKTSKGGWQQVPQVSIAHQNQKIMLQAAAEFGLTPSSRSRMIADQAVSKESDEMELLLVSGGRS